MVSRVLTKLVVKLFILMLKEMKRLYTVAIVFLLRIDLYAGARNLLGKIEA